MLGELGLGGSLRRRSSIGKAYHATARLIVCRLKRLNPKSVPEGQAELFGAWRHHVIFTDSPFVLAQAEPMHREHAQVEQVFADLEDSALAHLPSGKFTANAAWLTLAAPPTTSAGPPAPSPRSSTPEPVPERSAAT
ncbi:hypothetical protein [Streptomyces mirabilis]|uniref:hypothetical protein n=1 Tax=Streptomyces mirabilis TaxID=68239 RepID=UPI00368EB1CF